LLGNGQMENTVTNRLPADAATPTAGGKRQKTTPDVAANGWVVYAKARRELNGDRGGRISEDDTIGMLLVSSASRTAARFHVHVLATHWLYLKRGVADAMWARLEEELRNLQTTRGFDLIVSGGSCLNNPQSASFYRKHGFSVPNGGGGDEAIAGWSKTYEVTGTDTDRDT
jgi:GNAT superfamily N-acetyltransferase